MSASVRGGGSCSREYRSISSRSTVASVPYSRMKAIRLIHSVVVLTVGEIPFLVSMMPCTIHGCRPLSVRNQPAVFMPNGSTAPHTAPQSNTPEVASFFPPTPPTPHPHITPPTPPP